MDTGETMSLNHLGNVLEAADGWMDGCLLTYSRNGSELVSLKHQADVLSREPGGEDSQSSMTWYFFIQSSPNEK